MRTAEHRLSPLPSTKAYMPDWEAVLDVALIAVWELDLVSGTWRSHRLEKILGCADSQSDWSCSTFIRRVVDEDRARIIGDFHSSLREGSDFCCECRILRADGQERWIAAKGRCTHDDRGRQVRMTGTVQDVTERKAAEYAMRESEARLLVAVRNPAVVPAQADRELRYRWIYNPHCDFDSSAVIGKRDDELEDSEGVRQLMALKRRVIASGTSEREQISFARSDGIRVYDILAEPLFSGESIVGVNTASLDVTERWRTERALRQSERIQRLIADVSGLVMQHSTIEGLIRAVGERIGVELGLSRCGFSCVDVEAGRLTILADYHSVLPSISGVYPVADYMGHWLADGLAGRTAAIEDIATHTHTAAQYESVFAPIQIRAHISVPLHRQNRWVANFWAAHHEPRRWTEGEVELLQLVAERAWSFIERAWAAEELMQANERLRREDRLKDEFLATLSHELRNPLAAVSNVVKLLDSRLPGDPQLRRYLEILQRQAAQLNRLVDDLLDVSRVTRGLVMLDTACLDLRSVVHAALAGTKPLLEEKRHQLSLDVPPTPVPVLGDAMRLEQVFAILLTNAAKYTPPGSGHVHVTLALTEHTAQLRVRDNGIGLAPETIRHIFSLFCQAERRVACPDSGLGVGLTIARRLVELHSGRIAASSDGLGKGAEFVITLPLVKSAP